MADTSTIKTLEQKRAQAAWNAVEKVVNKTDSFKPNDAEYKGLVKNAPVLILTNGLTQTLAFFAAKKKPHHLALAAQISTWVKEQLNYNIDLLPRLLAGNSADLRLATQESLAYLQWLRRFADAQIDKEPKEDNGG